MEENCEVIEMRLENVCPLLKCLFGRGVRESQLKGPRVTFVLIRINGDGKLCRMLNGFKRTL